MNDYSLTLSIDYVTEMVNKFPLMFGEDCSEGILDMHDNQQHPFSHKLIYEANIGYEFPLHQPSGVMRTTYDLRMVINQIPNSLDLRLESTPNDELNAFASLVKFNNPDYKFRG